MGTPSPRVETRDHFDDAVRPHLSAMARSAERVTGSSDLAWDSVQDVLLRVWTRGWLPDEPAGALCHLARMSGLQQLRSARRRCRHEACARGGEECLLDEPSAVLERRDRIDRVRRAVDRLPREQRDVIELHAFGGLGYGQIASERGLPVGTVRSRLHRARHALRRDLATDTEVAP